jgi:hypothetical protein
MLISQTSSVKQKACWGRQKKCANYEELQYKKPINKKHKLQEGFRNSVRHQTIYVKNDISIERVATDAIKF